MKVVHKLTKIVLNMKDSKCTQNICNKCNAALLHQCLVTCTLCKKEVKKYSAHRCHANTDNESSDECECTKEKNGCVRSVTVEYVVK